MLTFPDISPEIFSISIGGFELALRWYAVAYILGFIFAIILMKLFVRNNKLWMHHSPPMSEDQIDSLFSYLVLGVILGGRIGYVVFYNFDHYVANPADIVRVWDGGMAFHGGFMGVVLAVFMFCRLNGLPLWSVADLIALATPPGLFLGRVSNFINAELWGRPTNVPWGVVFPGNRAQNCEGIIGLCARHPTQLYEAVLEGFVLFIFLIVLTLLGSLKKPGLIAGVFFTGYGLSRFWVEFYRVPDPQFFSDTNQDGFAYQLAHTGVTMGQALSIPMVLFGTIIVFFAFFKRRGKKL